MKKMLKPVSCSLVAIFALSIATTSPKIGPFGVDSVSAASVAAPAKPTTPTKTPVKTPVKTTTPSKSTTTVKTATPVATSVTKLLRLNSMGGEVKLLQTTLNTKGYKLNVDGIFGKLTLAAVKDYQGKNGLAVDGLVGPATLAKLNPKPAVVTPVVKPVVTQPTTKGDVKVTTADYKLTDAKIIGNVTVSAANFTMSKNAKVEGTVYFATQEAKDTFKIDATSSVTGGTVLIELDAVATATANASYARTEADLVRTFSATGSWIPSILNDITTTKELVLDGTFKNGKKDAVTGLDVVARKIALYSQAVPAGSPEGTKKVVTRRFTLTAPKLTIKSPNANISNGIFVGDIYVSAEKFQLIGTKVQGNVYFTTQAAKDSFKMDANSSITGKQILIEVDAVATATANASYARTEADLVRTFSKDGVWIPSILNDITTTKELVLDGTFTNGKKDAVTGLDVVARKIALYSQDDKRVVTRRFTLTAPKLTIKSPNANISQGIFVGDIYVSAEKFQLIGTKVQGNVYFTTQAAKDSFKMDANSSISGNQILIEVDAVATATANASYVRTEADLVRTFSATGSWIPSLLNDVTTTKELVLDGTFKNGKKDAVTGLDVVARKIALYSQDDKRVVTRRFTLTAPKLTIKSPNANISQGIFVGDIYVSAEKFQLIGTKVVGNVYFTTQAAKDSFKMDANSSISGNQELKLN